MISDNPITRPEDDLLGYTDYAYILKKQIVESTDLPICVGVYGSWGTGKTSLMKILLTLLSKEKGIKCIWFNPWKYDKKEDLWHALIHTIVNKVRDEDLIDEPIKAKLGYLTLSVTWLAVRKLLLTLSGSLLTDDDLNNLIKSLSTKDSMYNRHINQFEHDFAEVVNHYTKGGKLVIFVDDLDRCLPENALLILEGIKLFIGNANCIFVLGMDYNIIRNRIDNTFKDQVLNGRDYLDKIVQLPFFIPPGQVEKLRRLSLSIDDSSLNLLWSIIQNGTNNNPRKIKRYLNSLNLTKAILENRSSNENLFQYEVTPSQVDIYIAIILMFQMAFPSFYEHLMQYPGDWKKADEVLAKKLDNKDIPDRLRNQLSEYNLCDFLLSVSPNSFLEFPSIPDISLMTRLLTLTSAFPIQE